MEKAMNYIYGDLSMVKEDVRTLAKNLNKQRSVNRILLLLIGVGAVYSIGLAKGQLDNEEKIETLTKEIEELKTTKGE